MRRSLHAAGGLLGALLIPAPLLADGCLIPSTLETQTGKLSQSRQEVIMVLADGAVGQTGEPAPTVTYILRSEYTGDAADLAWVVPSPATPTQVSSDLNDDLFKTLAAATAPRFYVPGPPRSSMGCDCAGTGAANTQGGLVTVEASGRAGVFDWAALTSGGSAALVGWLNSHGYNVPADAEPILQTYIDQDWHFLAVRIKRPLAVLAVAARKEIPPIQFTCATSRRVYPLLISRISAVDSTELIVYVAGAHRARAKNADTATISESELALNPANSTGTTYEDVFSNKVAALGGPALITEWADTVRAGTLGEPVTQITNGLFLTRLRTVLTPAQMDRDLEFEDAPDDAAVSGVFYVGWSQYALMALAGPGAGVAVAGLATVGLKRICRRRWRVA